MVLPASTSVELSIVSTLYNSAEFVDEFVARCIQTANEYGSAFELILIDDGSPDKSLEKALVLAQKHPQVTVVELARNFGHHSAILAGLRIASGARVFLVDSDLEEPPELLLEFSKRMKETGADVVFGVHRQEVGTYFRKLSSQLFWKSFNLLSEVRTEPNICNVRLMTRSYVDALLELGEKNVFLGGLFIWPGFNQQSQMIDRKLNRRQSTYIPTKRFALAVRSIVAFSAKPLHLIFWLGTLIATLSGALGSIFLINKIIRPEMVLSGFTSLIISIWFLCGLIMASLGVIGIYLAFVYTEVKGRPRAVIRSMHRPSGE